MARKRNESKTNECDIHDMHSAARGQETAVHLWSPATSNLEVYIYCCTVT